MTVWLFDALDARLQTEVQQFRSVGSEVPTDGIRGLYISDAEVDGLLESQPLGSVGRVGQVSARLPRLMHIFGLDAVERDAFLICLAPEVDLRYERLYGYLQDDMTRRRPTVDLALRLLGQDGLEVLHALGPDGRLARRGLVERVGEDAAEPDPFLSTTLRVHPRVTEYLFGLDGLDRRLENWATLVEPGVGQSAAAGAWMPESEWLRARLSSAGDGSSPGPIAYIHGDPACGLLLARQWASAVGTRLLVVDFAAWQAAPGAPVAAAVAREAILQDAALVLRGIAPSGDQLSSVRRLCDQLPKLTFLIGDSRWEPARFWADRQTLSIDVRPPSSAARTYLWAAHLDDRFPANAAQELGARYRMVDADDLGAVARGALGRAGLRGSAHVSLADLFEVARTVASPELGGLAEHLEPRHAWDDIVLPADGILRMRELCARFRHRATVYETWGYAGSARRRGVAALFVGLPGTGKTMAAEIIAADLAYDLYRVDLSAVVSKYVGETEKNLEAIFRAAESGEIVLLFDEADALFGKRSEVRDAHDRYANIEVAYLLQRLETYSGVAILTSNLSGNLDEAFLRRLDAVVEFPFPQEAERCEIWRRSLPEEAPRTDDVDPAELARSFKLTGGHIRNSALAAAFLAADEGAPIGRRHLLHAIRREYEKVGKLVS